MELKHLRYFVALAEERHFGRAAARLHIVQPALSMQIRALEEELGGSLFERTSRRVELTEAGALLLVEARRTIEQAERARRVAQRSLRGEVGSVKAAFAGFAVLTGQLIQDLRGFHRAYPDVELTLGELAPHLQAEAILEGRLDVGYCSSLDFGFDPRLRAETIGRWPMVLALPSDHRLAARRRLTLGALAGEAFILYAPDDDQESPLARLRGLLGSDMHVAHRVSNTLSVLAMVGAGLGIALVPQPLEPVAIPNLSYRPLVGAPVLAELVLLSRAAETSGAVRAFVDMARARAA